MIRRLYTVRDEASTIFMAIQCNETDEVAIRGFDYALSSNELMKFRPEDFSLWYVGDYDDLTAIIDAKDPVCLKRGAKRGRKSE